MKAFGILKRVLAVLGIILLAAVLLLVAINWNDRAPNANSQRLDTVLRDQPAVAPALNGYVHMLALNIPIGQHVVATGTVRAARLNQAVASMAPLSSEFADGFAPIPSTPSAKYAALYARCKELDSQCENILTADLKQLDGYIASTDWLASRYGTMLLAPVWHEVAGPIEQLPAYGTAINGQRVHFLRAWLAARQGNRVAVEAALAADIRFWRNMQASSSTLISKMIALVAISRHFRWSGMVLRAMERKQQAAMIPTAWQQPFSRQERSMLLVMAGEHAFVRRALTVRQHVEDPDSAPMNRGLTSGLFKPQDYINRYANFAVAFSKEFDADYLQLPQAFRRANAMRPVAEDGHFSSRLYNPGGTFIAAESSGMGNYAMRVADLEGVRRAALLAVQLRSNGIAPQDVQSHLDRASLRDPYTDKPFTWDIATGAIVVQGLAQNNGGKYLVEL